MHEEPHGPNAASLPAWSPTPPSSLAAARQAPPVWLTDVERIVGASFVLSQLPDRWVYSRDRSPYALFQARNARIPATLPSAIACPGSVTELAALLEFTRANGIPVIPFGGGSGVLGGALPIGNELIVDLKRLNRIIALDAVDATVVVQAGMNGGQFEAELNASGYTCGHLPQSLHMSTVGGWAACRGAGQNSTRYGKIEDMVLGLEVVMPDGRLLRIRPSSCHGGGPDLAGLFLGAEGTLGIITELTLRIWQLPEARHGLVAAFPNLQAGLDALRFMMQRELRPAVARLYDEVESLHRTQAQAPFDTHPILAIFEFSGINELAMLERKLAIDIIDHRCGGLIAGSELYDEWLANRFGSLSTTWQARDHYVDTMEIVAGWSALPGLYDDIRHAVRALSPDFYFGAHWSHVYPEGACQYMTVRLPPRPEDEALHLLRSAWNQAQDICLAAGGSIAHHHGIGLFRGTCFRRELGATGRRLLKDLKSLVDPGNLLVPGKLGLGIEDETTP